LSRDNNEQDLGEVINRLLKAYGLEEGYYEAAIITHWENLMGRAVATRTREVKLKQGVLTVYLESASLRQELMYSREKIVQRINEEMGINLVIAVELK